MERDGEDKKGIKTTFYGFLVLFNFFFFQVFLRPKENNCFNQRERERERMSNRKEEEKRFAIREDRKEGGKIGKLKGLSQSKLRIGSVVRRLQEKMEKE